MGLTNHSSTINKSLTLHAVFQFIHKLLPIDMATLVFLLEKQNKMKNKTNNEREQSNVNFLKQEINA